MMCFRDMTFCGHYPDANKRDYVSDCVNTECPRYFSVEDMHAAEKWMNEPPIAFADMSARCDKYISPGSETSNTNPSDAA